MFAFWKKDKAAAEGAVRAWTQEIETESRKIGNALSGFVPPILDRAADTISTPRAEAIREKTRIETRLAELQAEGDALLEQHSQSVLVLDMTDGGLKHLTAGAAQLVPEADAPLSASDLSAIGASSGDAA